MTIARDYQRTEHDDFVLNVQDNIGNQEEAIPIVSGNTTIGWKIQPKYE